MDPAPIAPVLVPLEASFRAAFVRQLESRAAVEFVVLGAAGDCPIDMQDEAAGTVHRSGPYPKRTFGQVDGLMRSAARSQLGGRGTWFRAALPLGSRGHTQDGPHFTPIVSFGLRRPVGR
jgi:hypothetical protein